MRMSRRRGWWGECGQRQIRYPRVAWQQWTARVGRIPGGVPTHAVEVLARWRNLFDFRPTAIQLFATMPVQYGLSTVYCHLSILRKFTA